ncbi:MAG TPA: AAA family ATPase [Giesbergeria sp.]|nr:AAA family ATPase [Giesbergeria sp.]
MMATDIERARAALQAIPSDCDRDTWVRAGMAARAAGLDFEDFDSWSAQAGNYDARAARDTWRSFKPGKGVGAGTLHRMAAEHGHQQERPLQGPTKPIAPPRKPRAGMAPADVWARCEPATWAHPYIERKAAAGVPLDTLRVVPAGDALRIGGHAMAGALAVPAYAADGTLQSLQLIPPEGKKMNLPGAPMAGASFTVGTPDAGPLYIVEGIGQAWACWQATGHRAVVCFGWGNVGTVARAILKKDNAARLVLVPDVGKEAQAETIARELGCSVAAMPQGEAQNFDCNDLAQRDGPDVLAALLESVQSFKPEPLLTPVDVAGVLTRPSPPPRFVWDGYAPRGVVTLLGAHGGTGKSTIALMLAAAVATGRELFGIATEPAPVVFASFEDGAHIVRHRLAHICQCLGINPAELAGLHIVDGTANPELFASEGRGPGDVTPAYGELLALVQQTGAGLVIVDNASDAYGGDEIQRRQVRAFMRSLAVIAREGDAAVLLLAHVDKGTSRKERSDTEGYSGSTAWHNSARSRIFMSRDAAGLLTLAHQKSNLAKLREPLALEWPEGGLPQAASSNPFSERLQGRADDERAAALLSSIAEFESREQYCSPALFARNNVHALLKSEPAFLALKLRADDTRRIVNQCQRAGWLEVLDYRSPDRKERQRWAVTQSGRDFANLPAPTAPTAPTYEDGAQGAGGAPTAPTYVGGMGDSARTNEGASAGADTEGTAPTCTTTEGHTHD